MNINDVILSAIVAATVSLVTVLVTYRTTLKSLAVEREKLEIEREKFKQQQQRILTEKLYDLRLESYPKALKITEGLRWTQLVREDEILTEKHLNNILAQLDEWNSTQAAFLLSNNALQALYAIRRALRSKPEANGRYSNEQIKQIWDAKGALREALRNDIILLYSEEIDLTSSEKNL